MLMSLEPTVSEPIGRARPARSHDHLLAAGSLITQLMIVLDMTIIAVALPSMQADLGLTDSQRPWAVTAYTLANGGLVLFGGRLTTILGIRRSYWIGQTGFAAASLIAGLASSFPVLVGARTAQGAFAALLGPTALSLLNTAFPDGPRRRRVFALFGATAGVGAAAGLLIGGALTDWFSWRWSLYVNVLIAAIGFLIGLRGLPTSKSRHDGPAFSDLLGLVLGCGACFSAVFGLDRAEQTSWTSATTIGWLSAAAVLAVAFLLRERVATAPTLPLWIISQPARAASYAAVATVGAAQMGGAVYLTYYLQNHFGYSPLRTGIAFLPMIGALVVTAPLAGQYLLRRLGTRVVLPLGIAIEGAAFLMLSRIETTSTYAGAVVPGIIVLGIGIGCIMPAAINTGTRGVPGPHVGLASAVVTVGQQIGASLGVALLATYSTSRADDYVTDHADTTRAAAGQALQQAQAAPDSEAGRTIIARFTADLADRAQVDAFGGGFLLMARILAAAALLLALAAAIVLIRRRRTAVPSSTSAVESPAVPARPDIAPPQARSASAQTRPAAPGAGPATVTRTDLTHAVDLTAAPMGLRVFHPNTDINFQANRWAEAIGPRSVPEIRAVAGALGSLPGWVASFLSLADAARADGRRLDAAYYDRAAEFFMPPTDARKAPTRSRYVDVMQEVFDLRPLHVPYGSGSLPVYDIAPAGPAMSTWVIFGGFDSYIEDYLPMYAALARRGRRVVAFDGPGQGGALMDDRIPMTHEWEWPVRAVLDSLGLADITLMGISLGGGLAIRAAAFEPRVARVIAFDAMDDFAQVITGRVAPLAAGPASLVARHWPTRTVDATMARLARRSAVIDWGMWQGMHVTGTTTPSAFLRTAGRMRTAAVAERVRADVLLLQGAEDHDVPVEQMHRQAMTLRHARSLTTRTFTAAESCASHCQVGNIGLAIRTMLEWETAVSPMSSASSASSTSGLDSTDGL